MRTRHLHALYPHHRDRCPDPMVEAAVARHWVEEQRELLLGLGLCGFDPNWATVADGAAQMFDQIARGLRVDYPTDPT